MKIREATRFNLEASTNTHVLESDDFIEIDELHNGVVKMKINGNGIITHNEHRTIVTESENVLKYIQQELNPITNDIRNVFD